MSLVNDQCALKGCLEKCLVFVEGKVTCPMTPSHVLWECV